MNSDIYDFVFPPQRDFITFLKEVRGAHGEKRCGKLGLLLEFL